MRIRVLHDYAGRVTREHRIYPGEYDLYDPDLFNCGKHLLEIGVAVAIEDDPVVSHSWDTTVETSDDNVQMPDGATVVVFEDEAHGYDAMTVEELRAECEARGIGLDELEGSGSRGKLVKADYVAVLEGDDADAEKPDTLEFNGRTIELNDPEGE